MNGQNSSFTSEKKRFSRDNVRIASKKMLKYTGNAMEKIIPKNWNKYQKVEVKYPFHQVDVEDFTLFIKEALIVDIETGN